MDEGEIDWDAVFSTLGEEGRGNNRNGVADGIGVGGTSGDGNSGPAGHPNGNSSRNSLIPVTVEGQSWTEALHQHDHLFLARDGVGIESVPQGTVNHHQQHPEQQRQHPFVQHQRQSFLNQIQVLNQNQAQEGLASSYAQMNGMVKMDEEMDHDGLVPPPNLGATLSSIHLDSIPQMRHALYQSHSPAQAQNQNRSLAHLQGTQTWPNTPNESLSHHMTDEEFFAQISHSFQQARMLGLQTTPSISSLPSPSSERKVSMLISLQTSMQGHTSNLSSAIASGSGSGSGTANFNSNNQPSFGRSPSLAESLRSQLSPRSYIQSTTTMTRNTSNDNQNTQQNVSIGTSDYNWGQIPAIPPSPPSRSTAASRELNARARRTRMAPSSARRPSPAPMESQHNLGTAAAWAQVSTLAFNGTTPSQPRPGPSRQSSNNSQNSSHQSLTPPIQPLSASGSGSSGAFQLPPYQIPSNTGGSSSSGNGGVESPQGSVLGPEDSEDKRIRNTQASARFRAKKKMHVQIVQRNIQDLEKEHGELEKEVDDFRKENGFLKEMVSLKYGGNNGNKSDNGGGCSSTSDAGGMK